MTDHPQKSFGQVAPGSSLVEGAAGRLLEREPPEGYRAEWTQHIAKQKISNSAILKSCVVFRIHESFLALPTSLVDTIAENSAFHTIPRRKSGIPITLANVRGELVICASLSALLGIDITEANDPAIRKLYPHLISCRRADQRFAFPVDEICSVEKYPMDEIGDVPATLAGSANNYTRGLLFIGNRTVGLVDEELLFDAWSRSLL